MFFVPLVIFSQNYFEIPEKMLESFLNEHTNQTNHSLNQK